MWFAGIDIGGANIKFAILGGETTEISFPIWRDKDRLGLVLQELATRLKKPACLGVTMTAELADCFANKQEGVRFVVQAVADAFPDSEPKFYLSDGEMCDAVAATIQWRSVAASNWHGLAWLAFLESEEPSGFVFDIGSTTSDIIPVKNRLPVGPGQNDLQRLRNGQLLYAGVGRTPVCSLLREVQFEFGSATIARELFATMSDVFLWLGQVKPGRSSVETADGRPASIRHAGHRLARMVCADFEDLDAKDIDQIARQSKRALINELSRSLVNVMSTHPSLPFVFKTFGRGAWLAEEVVLATLSENEKQSLNVRPFSNDDFVNQTASALAVAQRRQQIHLQTRFSTNG